MPAAPTPRARARTTTAIVLRTTLALATACGPGPADTATDASTSTTATTADPTTEPTTGSTPTTDATTGADAACLERVYEPKYAGVDDPEWELGCGAPKLCPGEGPLLFRIEGEPADPSAVATPDLPRARCMLAALRDREVGQLDFLADLEGGIVLGLFAIELLGAQAITRVEPGACDLLSPCLTQERLRALQEPAFFAACVDGDARDLWLCLIDAVLPDPACAPGPLACP